MHKHISLRRPQGLIQWLKLYQLYRTAFPRSERKPFSMIVKMFRKHTSDVWYCVDNGNFVGLAITINGPEQILLDYFAIVKGKRSSGYGSAILKELFHHYAPKSVFGEIESVYEDGEDQLIRQRRKQFYLDNGMHSMGVMVYLFGVKMELLTNDHSMTFEEYRDFYCSNYSPWAAEHILPAESPKEGD